MPKLIAMLSVASSWGVAAKRVPKNGRFVRSQRTAVGLHVRFVPLAVVKALPHLGLLACRALVS